MQLWFLDIKISICFHTWFTAMLLLCFIMHNKIHLNPQSNFHDQEYVLYHSISIKFQIQNHMQWLSDYKYSNINNAEGLSCLALAHAQLMHRIEVIPCALWFTWHIYPQPSGLWPLGSGIMQSDVIMQSCYLLFSFL